MEVLPLDAIEASGFKVSEWNKTSGKAMGWQVANAKAELMRLQGDPMGEVLLEEVLESIKSNYEESDKWMLLVTERQLANSKASSKDPSHLKPIRFIG